MVSPLQSFLTSQQAGLDAQASRQGLAQRDLALEQQRQAQALSQRQTGISQEQERLKFLNNAGKAFQRIPTVEGRVRAASQLGAMAQRVGVDPSVFSAENLTNEKVNQMVEVSERFARDPQAFTAAQREFDFLAEQGQFTPEQRKQAARVGAGIEGRATAVTPELVAERERQKLEAQRGIKAEVAGEVEVAKGTAKEQVKASAQQKKDERTFAVFTTALNGLSEALGATSLVGPIAGRIPATTTSAQIAEGAKAIMLPTLKQIFRQAGEGTFTDADQRALEQLLPRRDQTRDAQLAQIDAIEKIVRAKMGIPDEEEVDPLLREAEAAIAAGAPRDAVMQRLEQLRNQ